MHVVLSHLSFYTFEIQETFPQESTKMFGILTIKIIIDCVTQKYQTQNTQNIKVSIFTKPT